MAVSCFVSLLSFAVIGILSSVFSQSSRLRRERERERESCFLYFNCSLGAMWLFILCVSSDAVGLSAVCVSGMF